MAEKEKKICFVICPIGKPDTDVRKRSDAILDYIISPVVQQFDYEALRADKISETGMITYQVIEHLLEDPLVVADLTDNNANVYYELAIRHAIKKPVIHIIEFGQTPPFDTKDIRTVPVASEDLKIAEEAKAQISKHIKALEKAPTKIVTPISMTIDLKQIRESSKGEDKADSIILDYLTQITNRLSSIEQNQASSIEAPPTYSDVLQSQSAFHKAVEAYKQKMDAEQTFTSQPRTPREKVALLKALKDLREKDGVKD